MLNAASWPRRIGLATLLVLAACDNVRGPLVWPSREALEAFDTSQLESNRAVQIVEAVAVADGFARVCGDVPLPPNLRIDDDRLKQLEEDIGEASQRTVLAEVERLHPGHPENRWAAEHIWVLMTERNVARGRDAAKARGCEATKPEYTAAWKALRSWQPAAQGDPSPPAATP
jgi:hypothetical protein